jgi:6-aminohexanoate-oligomer endohydrolase
MGRVTAARLAPESKFKAGAPGNRDSQLEPHDSPAQATVAYDFPAVLVGTAEYAEGPTGCTVIYIPSCARTAVDVRGGSVGMSGGYPSNHAICLAGGSVYGLAAAAGVSEEILAQRQNDTRWDQLALVSGAIIYDLSVRDNAVVPDAALGRRAFHNARSGAFPVGRCGGGCSASVGKVDPARAEFSGQGAAFAEHAGVKVLVATVVNAIGVVVDRNGSIVRGNYDVVTGTRRHPAEDYAQLIGHESAADVRGNTTITVLVTNARLSDTELRQVGRQVHSSMHRAIQPFHTEADGDVLFALTTEEVDLTGVGSVGLGALASEVAWDAVLASVQWEAGDPG